MYIEYLAGQKYPSKNAEISEDLNSFDDAGYLIQDDEIIVDIDCLDHEKIRGLIKHFHLDTETVWTDRGAHLYFKLPKGFNRAEGICALGFKCEFKRKKNDTSSVTVKRFGNARKVENKGVRLNLPDFFKPKKGKNAYPELLGMSEGEGRNNALFRMSGILNKFENKREMLFFINKFIFSKPLPEDELESIAGRASNELSEKEEEFVIANNIMESYRTVRFNRCLYYFNGYRYINDDEAFEQEIYSYCDGKNTRFEEEVFKQVKKRSPIISTDETFDIKFKNGVLSDGEFFYVNYIDFTPYYIDIEYDSNAEPVETVEEYLKHLSKGDESYRQRILEVMAHCLITNKEFKRMIGKFFIFIGDGSNGKGTLLEVIQKILGEDNCGALSLTEMKDEKYLNSLVQKLCNLGDDLDNESIDNKKMKLLKNISTCDRISTRKLYENASPTKFHCTLIFTSNHILKSFEKGDAYKRRVDWLPVFTKVVKKDRKFISKLTTPKALKYWIKLIIDAYFGLYEREDYTPCDIINDYNKRYHEINDNTIPFVKDLTLADMTEKTPKEIFEDYKLWCDENLEHPLSVKQLKQTILTYWGYEEKIRKKHGKSRRIFVKTKEGLLDIETEETETDE